VAQNIIGATYKRWVGGSRGRVEGGWVGGGLRLPFRHDGTSCVPKEPLMAPQTTLQGIAGHLITVVDNWKQLHTNATFLKPAKH